MTTDRYDLDCGAAVPAALPAFAEAVEAIAAHRPQAGPALGRALAADPEFIAAHALRGFASLILAKEELLPAAAEALAEADRAAMRRAASADEAALVSALRIALAGSFRHAADELDLAFSDRPATLLPFKIGQALRFMAGDAAGMLTATDRMLPAWRPDLPAAGFLLGCHAFALEEHGHYAAAEVFGRQAVAIEPTDAWGCHAVSHVFEMRGEATAGIDWLEATRADWSRCNNFSFHMAWHLALFHLERGDHAQVLAVYDADVRPVQTDDFRDVANAVSLLWRLERSGCDVGARWEELAPVVRQRRTDTTLVFASLHTLTALMAVGDHAAAGDLVGALEAKSRGACEQARIAADVGVPLARIISGVRRGRQHPMDRLARELPGLGGSNAQRDLFMLTLAEAASRDGGTVERHRIRQLRRRLKAEDRLIAAVERRGLSEARPASAAV